MPDQTNVSELFILLVAKEMVACGETRQVVPSVNRWEIACMLYPQGNKERAKDGLTRFLQLAWRASGIRFYQKHKSKPGQFWVSFTSDDF